MTPHTLDRRALLAAAGVAVAGLAASPVRSAVPPGKARSVLLIDLFGGPSHLDMFDPKPDAPAEVRGEFGTIASAVPGVRVCEYLPRLAARLDRTCLVRTLTHRYNSHNPYCVMTGFDGGNDQENYFAKPKDHPGIGAVLQYAGLRPPPGVPPYVVLPAYPGYSQGLRRAGPYGGYLGGRFDPLFTTCEPIYPRPVNGDRDFYDDTLPIAGGEPTLTAGPGLTTDDIRTRRSLLDAVTAAGARLDVPAAERLADRQRQAFAMLLSDRAREAFDLSREPLAVRERYGRDLFGSSVLMARRLVEAGVTFTAVHTEAKGPGHWDTHKNNFRMLKHQLLPFLDRAVSSLLDDLADRGLLETTLVIVAGDMGRTPKVNGSAGRDHWPACGFALLAGGGTRPGLVYGTSDRQGAYPKDLPVSAGDLTATIYGLMGVDPELMVPDLTGRPNPISHGGRPVAGLLA